MLSVIKTIGVMNKSIMRLIFICVNVICIHIIGAVVMDASAQLDHVLSGSSSAAAPTKDFLLGKTHFEKDTNFIEIPPQYTVLRRPNNFIQKRTFEAFLKMHAAAKADGVRLVATSASRNFWVQRYIWEQKWQKTTSCQGAARAKYILQYNSMCGTSRHHWGTELDLNSPKLEYWNSAEGKKTYQWLCQNAHKFGFYQPYSKKSSTTDPAIAGIAAAGTAAAHPVAAHPAAAHPAADHPHGEMVRTTGYNEEKWHWSYYPLANMYMNKYRELIKEEDLKGFLGEQYVKELDIIEHYVFGVATPPEP